MLLKQRITGLTRNLPKPFPSQNSNPGPLGLAGWALWATSWAMEWGPSTCLGPLAPGLAAPSSNSSPSSPPWASSSPQAPRAGPCRSAFSSPPRERTHAPAPEAAPRSSTRSGQPSLTCHRVSKGSAGRFSGVGSGGSRSMYTEVRGSARRTSATTSRRRCATRPTPSATWGGSGVIP